MFQMECMQLLTRVPARYLLAPARRVPARYPLAPARLAGTRWQMRIDYRSKPQLRRNIRLFTYERNHINTNAEVMPIAVQRPLQHHVG